MIFCYSAYAFVDYEDKRDAEVISFSYFHFINYYDKLLWLCLCMHNNWRNVCIVAMFFPFIVFRLFFCQRTFDCAITTFLSYKYVCVRVKYCWTSVSISCDKTTCHLLDGITHCFQNKMNELLDIGTFFSVFRMEWLDFNPRKLT